MKRINKENLNTTEYWDEHIAENDFGLRQKKYLELAGKGEIIIELGCGLSPFLDKASSHFKKAIGYDFSQATCKHARAKYPDVTYARLNIVEDIWRIDTDYADVSVAGEVIEHLEDPEQLIKEMIRITKRRVIISTAKMEYNDPEHLWLIEAKDFPEAKTEIIKSEWFPGREYLFITIDL